MRSYLHICAAVAGLLGLGFALPAAVGQPPKIDAKLVAKPPAKPQLALKVFKLERANPGDVIGAMTSLLEDAELPPAVGTPPPGGGVGTPPPGGFGGMTGQGGGGLGGGIGGTFVPVWRATSEERTKSVIVRGSARHIQVAADLVALLDRAPNAPLPPLQVVKAFTLKNADSATLIDVITALEFEDLKLSNPEEKLLVVIGPEEATKAIAELVKELDVPGKPGEEPKAKPIPKQ